MPFRSLKAGGLSQCLLSQRFAVLSCAVTVDSKKYVQVAWSIDPTVHAGKSSCKESVLQFTALALFSWDLKVIPIVKCIVSLMFARYILQNTVLLSDMSYFKGFSTVSHFNVKVCFVEVMGNLLRRHRPAPSTLTDSCARAPSHSRCRSRAPVPWRPERRTERLRKRKRTTKSGRRALLPQHGSCSTISPWRPGMWGFNCLLYL